MPGYKIHINYRLEKTLERLLKKDRKTYDRISQQIYKISQNPEIGKPLRHSLKGKRRVHIGSYVLVYRIDDEDKVVEFLDFDHHDKAYK